MGNFLEAHVTLHEIAHAWLNADPFDSRWGNEGLANEFAAHAMEDRGMERPLPDEVVTVDACDGWSPPATLRLAMSTWSFDDTAGMVPEVEDLLGQKATITASLSTINEDVPTAPQKIFESSRDLDRIAVAMDAAELATTDYVRAVTSERSAVPATRAGRFIVRAAGSITDAREALARGDLSAAEESARRVIGRIDTARWVGPGGGRCAATHARTRASGRELTAGSCHSTQTPLDDS